MKKETVLKIVKCLFIIYCIALVYILFLHGYRIGNQFNLKIFSKEHFEMSNIIPFKTIFCYLERAYNSTININIVINNLIGNLLMFIPMGIALPVLFSEKFDKIWKIILFNIILVVIIEIIQFITFTGSADIDDVILNAMGAILGYGITKIFNLKKFSSKN